MNCSAVQLIPAFFTEQIHERGVWKGLGRVQAEGQGQSVEPGSSMVPGPRPRAVVSPQ